MASPRPNSEREMPMVSFACDRDQYEALERIAKHLRISRSAAMRQAVDVFVRLNINSVDISRVDTREAA